MNPPTLRDDAQRKKDRDNLNLLSVFHFVIGGLALLGLGFLAVHYLIMRAMMSKPNMWNSPQNTPPFSPPQFMHVMVWFYLFMGLVCVAGSALNLLSGLFLRQRKNRVFSLVVAAFDCLQIPFGTVLGVFTIIVLMRDSVCEWYQQESRSGPPGMR
jgi:hypothetical protein